MARFPGMNAPHSAQAPRPPFGKPPAPRLPFGKTQAAKPAFMANGGFGAPAPIGGGGPPVAAPPMPPPGADPDMDGDTDSPTIKPEAVNYHDDAQSCQACGHFQDSQCEILKMQVSPDGGCTAFEGGSGGDDDGGGDQDDTDSTDAAPDDDSGAGGFPQR